LWNYQKIKNKNYSISGTTTERNRVPKFDGKEKSYDKWEIQWNAFVEVEGIFVL
jgi:hypothetical protein